MADPREPWDYEAFIAHYNACAREFSGYDFDRAGVSAEKLRGYYEMPIWDSLRDFARTRCKLDQQM